LKILICPQSFKGSLDALGVAEAIKEGLGSVWGAGHEYVISPVADGGEGTVEALITATRGRYTETTVEDPLGRHVQATWGMLPDGQTAVIEMAAASGLPRLQRSERNPMITSTFGTGQLIRAALDAGATRLIIGLGGSATNDAGAGMAHALGARFLDASGRYLSRGGKALLKLDRIDAAHLDPRLQETEIVLASDVTNVLCGPEGASAVYGPQKGASAHGIETLDRALANFAVVVKRDLGKDVMGVPGAGAAGGLGAGLMAFAGARIERGVDLIFEAMNFDSRLNATDVVFTGEGRVDAQDAFGKAPIVVAQRAAARNIPVVVIVGSIGQGYETVFDHGVSAVLSIVTRPMSIERAVAQTGSLIASAAAHAARLITVGTRLQIGMESW
jgi:glycerate kinase